MVDGAIAAMGTPAEVKRAVGAETLDEVFLRLTRPGTSDAGVRAFLGFVRKETLHLLRDRQTLAILILFPVVQVLIFGFAMRTDVRDIAIAIVDPTPDVATLELRERVAASDRFTRRPGAAQRGAARGARSGDGTRPPGAGAARRGRAPAGPGRLAAAPAPHRRQRSQHRPASCRAMPPRSWTGGTGTQVPGAGGLRIEPQVAHALQPDARERPPLRARADGVRADDRLGADDRDLDHAREGDRHDGDAAGLAPPALAIIVGKVIPYIVLGFVSVVLVLVAARLVFDVPLRGSLVLLLLESGLYIVTALALGIVISTKAPNQRTAMIAALAGLMLPTLLLSGFIFPLDSLPWLLQWLSYVVPARWFLTIVRGIMLKGAGLATLWQETLILVGMTLFLLVKGSRGLAIRLG